MRRCREARQRYTFCTWHHPFIIIPSKNNKFCKKLITKERNLSIPMIWQKKSNYMRESNTESSTLDKRRTLLDGPRMPFHTPDSTSQFILHSLTQCWLSCKCENSLKTLLENTLKTVPTGGNEHKTSLDKGSSSRCNGSWSSPLSRLFMVKKTAKEIWSNYTKMHFIEIE